MKHLFIMLLLAVIFMGCNTNTNHHQDYQVGNSKEVERAKQFINTEIVLEHFIDSVRYESYSKEFPCVFFKTDYNAVKYHRNYIDTVLLDTIHSEVLYDFFYLIEQDICLSKPDYLKFIIDYGEEKYNRLYRQ